MEAQIIAAYTTGVVFMLLLLGIACFIAFRKKPEPVPEEAMFIFRVILALAAAGFATVLSGFLEIDGKILEWKFRAAGSLAVFVAIYLTNPPDIIARRLPKPRKPRKVIIPADRIK
jgi:small-conductance mechanosensitive channel